MIVSHNLPKSSPLHFSIAFFTTPGPLTPTLIIQSASLTPWNAPAINGLSSGALHKTTSLAHPIESFSFVKSAVSLIISPINLTASILIPVLVEPTFTELQTLFVTFIASGIDSIKSLSAGVIPLETTALYPPIKLTLSSAAHRSKVLAILTKSFVDLHALEPTKPIGVTEIRLLTIGIPYFFSISSPVLTKSFATVVILLYIFLHKTSISWSIQSNKLIPIVIVRTSKFSCSIILFVSATSNKLIILISFKFDAFY